MACYQLCIVIIIVIVIIINVVVEANFPLRNIPKYTNVKQRYDFVSIAVETMSLRPDTPSTRFVVKPEGGSNVFLTKPVGGNENLEG